LAETAFSLQDPETQILRMAKLIRRIFLDASVALAQWQIEFAKGMWYHFRSE